jgi:hypothetical protein
MSKLVFFKKDGKGNIYGENGNETMDVVDEKPDPFAIKQLLISTRTLNGKSIHYQMKSSLKKAKILL